MLRGFKPSTCTRETNQQQEVKGHMVDNSQAATVPFRCIGILYESILLNFGKSVLASLTGCDSL